MMTPEEETQQRNILTTAHHDYARWLNLHAFLKVHNHALGEDLVQDTFTKTWLYLIRGGKIDVMKSFLYHILNNLIVDEYRKHKTISLDTLIEKGAEPHTDNSPCVFDILDKKAMLLLVQLLPPRYQKVVRLRYIQDLSLQEISLITGQSKNTIAVQVHRGLGKLKKLHDHHHHA